MSLRTKTDQPVAHEVTRKPAHTFARRVHAIRANVDGTCHLRMREDAEGEFVKYTLVAGEVVVGEFVEVLGSTFNDGELVGLVLPLE